MATTIDSVQPTSGPTSGGTELTITGSELDLLTLITLGGAPATGLRIISPSEARCFTPRAILTGAVDLVATYTDPTPPPPVSIMTSPNGVAWTSHTAPGTYNAVAAGSLGKLVAVGPSVGVSNDNGVTWTSVFTVPNDGGLQDVVFTGAKYLAVGLDNLGSIVYSSLDGETWAPVSHPANIGGYLGGIAWNGSIAVARGADLDNNPYIIFSNDGGATWTQASVTVPEIVFDGKPVVAGGPLFVIAKVDGIGDQYATSPDGDVWTLQGQMAASGSFLGGTWDGAKYVFVGFESSATSAAGLIWASGSMPAGYQFFGVVKGGSVIVAVGYLNSSPYSSVAATSTDGLVWTQQVTPSDITLVKDVVWNGTVFAAIGQPAGF